MKIVIAFAAAGVMTAVLSSGAKAQQQPPPGQGGRRGGAAAAFPERLPADPAVIERGKGIYSVNCQFCHGADTRGGDGGPSLLRSQLVQDDQHGELVAEVVQNGRPPRMPGFNLTTDQVAEVPALLHGEVRVVPFADRRSERHRVEVSRSARAAAMVAAAGRGRARPRR